MALEKAELDGGLKLYVDNMPSAQTANVRVFVGAGSIHEPDGLEGISHALEHCVHLKTEHFPNRQSLRDYDKINGLYTNASTYYTRTVYQADGTDPEPIFFRLGEVLFRTVYDYDNIANEMKVINREARTGLDNIQGLHAVAVDFSMFGAPHGRRVIGFSDHLNFSANQLKEYYDSNYHTGNMAVVAVGNINIDAVAKLAERHFVFAHDLAKLAARGVGRQLQKNHTSGLIREDSESLRIIRSSAVDGQLLEQMEGIGRTKFDIASDVISALMFEKLRNEYGISYDGGFGVSSYNDPSAWRLSAYVTTDGENRQTALDVFSSVLGGSSKGFEDDKIQAELSTNCYYALSVMDNLDSRTDFYVNTLSAGREPRDLLGLAKELKSLKVQDIRQTLDNLFEHVQSRPYVDHFTGKEGGVGDVDEIIDRSQIA